RRPNREIRGRDGGRYLLRPGGGRLAGGLKSKRWLASLMTCSSDSTPNRTSLRSDWSTVVDGVVVKLKRGSPSRDLRSSGSGGADLVRSDFICHSRDCVEFAKPGNERIITVQVPFRKCQGRSRLLFCPLQIGGPVGHDKEEAAPVRRRVFQEQQDIPALILV